MTDYAPGWHPDPQDPTMERYFNGSTWQHQRQPPPVDPLADAGMRLCPYCRDEIKADATRCRHCAGEMRYCPSCRTIVGLASKQKFVGMMRGGMKTQYRCQQCARVLDGPRF